MELTAREARQTERSGGQKEMGLEERNFCLSSLSAFYLFNLADYRKKLKSDFLF